MVLSSHGTVTTALRAPLPRLIKQNYARCPTTGVVADSDRAPVNTPYT